MRRCLRGIHMSKLISNYKAILKLLGIIIFIIGIAMIIPWITPKQPVIYRQPELSGSALL